MAAIVVVGGIFILCFVYFNCIRKTNAKSKIYVLMDEGKLDVEMKHVEEEKVDDEDWDEEDDED